MALLAGFGDVVGSGAIWHTLLYQNCSFSNNTNLTYSYDYASQLSTHMPVPSLVASVMGNMDVGCPKSPLVGIPVGVGLLVAALGCLCLDYLGK
jgi:hypothetical protein